VLNTKIGEYWINKVDASRIAMWKEGYLVFQEASLDEILTALGKRYDVTVHFDSGKFSERSYTVRFFPEESLEETLAVLMEITPDFTYTIKGSSLYIH
jgi:ferric-dicitrate binding protein FerR (iron transport regulator)